MSADYEPLDAATEIEICGWIATGRSVMTWCRTSDNAVSFDRVMAHVATNEMFARAYVAARRVQGHAMIERILTIVDALEDGTIRDVQRAGLVINTLRWGAERMTPAVYGPRQSVDHTSSDGSFVDTPTTITVQPVAIPYNKPDDVDQS